MYSPEILEKISDIAQYFDALDIGDEDGEGDRCDCHSQSADHLRISFGLPRNQRYISKVLADNGECGCF